MAADFPPCQDTGRAIKTRLGATAGPCFAVWWQLPANCAISRHWLRSGRCLLGHAARSHAPLRALGNAPWLPLSANTSGSLLAAAATACASTLSRLGIPCCLSVFFPWLHSVLTGPRLRVSFGCLFSTDRNSPSTLNACMCVRVSLRVGDNAPRAGNAQSRHRSSGEYHATPPARVTRVQCHVHARQPLAAPSTLAAVHFAAPHAREAKAELISRDPKPINTKQSTSSPVQCNARPPSPHRPARSPSQSPGTRI